MKKVIFTGIFVLSTVCSSFAAEVNLFTSRHYSSDVELYKKFTNNTGIKVNVIKAKYKVLEKRLLSEGKSSKADVIITVDAGALGSATKKGIFQKIKSETLNSKIPSNFRSAHWYGIAKRARLIYFNPETFSPEVAKNLNYEDLANPMFKRKVVIRKSSNVYNQSLVSSLVANNGVSKTSKWAKGLVSNMARKPKGNDRAQILAVAAGEADLAVANSYYIALMLSGKKGPEQQAAAKNIHMSSPVRLVREHRTNFFGSSLLLRTFFS